jgi:hypothetical protein
VIFFLGFPKIPVFKRPWEELVGFFLLALNSFFLPIVTSCLIYLKLICDNNKFFKNKVTISKEEISKPERQVKILGRKNGMADPEWSQQVPNNQDSCSPNVENDSKEIEKKNSKITESANSLRTMMELSVENLQQDSAGIQPSSNRYGDEQQQYVRTPGINATHYLSVNENSEEDDKLQISLQAQKTEALMSAAHRSIASNLIVSAIYIFVFTILLRFVSKSWRAYCVAVVFSYVKTALPVTMTIANFGTVQYVFSQYLKFLRKHFFGERFCC